MYVATDETRFVAVFHCQAFELLAIETPGPDEKPNLPPSRGNNNPAVLKYDPTGLRSTMSATEKARQESVQVCMNCTWHVGTGGGREKYLGSKRFCIFRYAGAA